MNNNNLSFATTALSAIAAPLTPTTPASRTTSDTSPSNDQATQTIIFGVLATVLAFAAVIVGYLQLRKFRHREDEELGQLELDTLYLSDLQ